MNSKNEPKTLEERLKYLRKKNGESQDELGKLLGLSQKAISNYENPKTKTKVSLEILTKYAEHYNVSLDYLVTGISSDSILKLLEKYISITFADFSIGAGTFNCPMLQINKVFFDYLMHLARIAQNKDMPKDVAEFWLNIERKTFYEQNKHDDFTKIESVVPMPQQLIFPDEAKSDWKQADLLREINNQLFKKSPNNA